MTINEFNQWAASKNIELVPEADGFKVGDVVTFTNDYGVVFHDLVIKGIDKDTSFYGRRFYIFDDCYWFPAHPNSIKKLNQCVR